VGSLLSERDLGLLSAFAALAACALENARLIEELRRKDERLEQMARQVDGKIASGPVEGPPVPRER
jgi:GAF domain-containing protein